MGRIKGTLALECQKYTNSVETATVLQKVESVQGRVDFISVSKACFLDPVLVPASFKSEPFDNPTVLFSEC